MQMKANHIRFFAAAAVTVLLSACAEEQIQPASPDRDDCMGVYFVEEQANATAHTLEKDVDKTSLDFIVRRVNADEAAEVPYEYNVYKVVQTPETDTTYKEEPVLEDKDFIFGKIKFAKGQKETKVNVSFESLPSGETYRCSMSITDPRYVLTYGYASSSLSFSVQIFEWRKITEGMAIFRDGFLTDVLGLDYGPQTEVEIYERRDKKGYFRLDNVYSASYLARLMEGDEKYQEEKKKLEEQYAAYVDEKSSLFVDASDPKRVFIPEQSIGLKSSFLGGIVTIASDVEEVYPGMSNLLYGTMENNIITFPKNGLIFGIAGTYYFSNTSAKTRIVLPGGKAEDYGIDLSYEDAAEDGSRPVTFKVTKDVATIKYKVFQGPVTEVTLADSLALAAAEGKVISTNGELKIKESVVPDKADAPTSIYTLIACAYGAGDTEYREYEKIEFGYIKPGDNREVEIYMGLSTSDQYASEKPDENYDSTNSFSYWVRGKDITNIQIGYYPTSYYETYKDKIEKSMIMATTANSQTLKVINGTGMAGILGNRLQPCTSYTFVVYAGNGYKNQFFTKTVTTEGKEDLTQKSYYFHDIKTFTQPGADALAGEWVAVSYDIFDAQAQKKVIRGGWRAETVTLTVEGDAVKAAGLFPALKTNPTIKFALKDGLLYSQDNTCAKVMVKDSTHLIPSMRFEYQYIPKPGAITTSGYFYEKFTDEDNNERTDMFCGGFVHEDIIAFVDNRTSFNFYALAMGGFQKGSMGEMNLVDVIGDGHGELILVRKGSDLLEDMKKEESTSVQPQTGLSLVKENSYTSAPEFGTIKADQKMVDQSVNSRVELRSGLQIKTTVK